MSQDGSQAIVPQALAAQGLEDETPAAPMIPRIGHVCWFGPRCPPKDMMDSWVSVNQDVLWSKWANHAGWQNQRHIDAKAQRREWNGVCDIIRYELLFKYGGIVVDADSEAVRPLSEGNFFEQTTAIACFENELVRPGIVGCGFLGAPKGHPFFEACIEEVAKSDPGEQPWKGVGPLLMKRVAERYPELIRVYPARMFNPMHYSGTAAPGEKEGVPVFARQGWGSTKGYNGLRKMGCGRAECPDCGTSMFNAPWR